MNEVRQNSSVKDMLCEVERNILSVCRTKNDLVGVESFQILLTSPVSRALLKKLLHDLVSRPFVQEYISTWKNRTLQFMRTYVCRKLGDIHTSVKLCCGLGSLMLCVAMSTVQIEEEDDEDFDHADTERNCYSVYRSSIFLAKFTSAACNEHCIFGNLMD